LTSVLSTPVAKGVALGGAGGATVGAITGEGENRFRNALVGGATGASMGALTGGLTSSGNIDRAMFGFKRGIQEAIDNPNITVSILESMKPEYRKIVLNRFKKGWLTRMFGG